MIRKGFVGLLFLVLTLPIQGEILLEQRGTPLSNRVHWLLDFSGSMQDDSAKERLIKIWVQAMKFQPDEAYIKVSLFNQDVATYSMEWRQLPDVELIEDLKKWIKATPAKGGTDIGGTIRWATYVDKDKDDLHLFVISDFEVPPIGMRMKVDEAKSIKPTPISVVGIGLKDHLPTTYYENAKWIAETSQGALILEEADKKEEEEEEKDKDPPKLPKKF